MQIPVWIFAERRRVSQHVGREVVAIGSRVTDVQGRNSHIVLSLEDLHDLPEHQRNVLKTGKGEDFASSLLRCTSTQQGIFAFPSSTSTTASSESARVPCRRRTHACASVPVYAIIHPCVCKYTYGASFRAGACMSWPGMKDSMLG